MTNHRTRFAPALSIVAALAAAALAAEPVLEKVDVFEAGSGGYAHYRIPGIVVTSRGTLLAYCEARKSTSGDWGAIDVLLRRSEDGGRTWSPPVKVVTPPEDIELNPVAVARGLAKPGEVTVNNPVAIADHAAGVVHLLYCVEYARCFYTRSSDDGRTFGEPVEITAAAFEPFRPEYDWKVLATGPGHGIRLSGGRLVVPVWLSTGTGGHAHRPSVVATILSDDGGSSWRRGEIVVAHPDPTNPSETVAVELADGRVMLNFRHESPSRRRGVVTGPDGAGGWSAPRYDPALPEPICMGSIVRLSARPAHDRDRILFANPHNPDGRERRNVTVKLSYDEGETWPVARSIEPGTSGYSDLAVGPDGAIYCFYERGTASDSHYNPRSLCVARCNLEWLTGGRDTLDGAAAATAEEGGAESIAVVVSAGEHHRRATPVFVDLAVDGPHVPAAAVVESERGVEPAQVEALPDGRARVWWVLGDLAAGASRRYTARTAAAKALTVPEFAWKDSSGEHGTSSDLVHFEKGQPRRVLRYMHAPFDAQRIELTKKPFHHVFDPDGSRPITKGGGGLYPHHRGIFFGYNRCRLESGETFDVWHAARGEHQVHREVAKTLEGPVLGGHEVRIDWNDRGGRPFAREVRRVVVYRQPDGTLLIDFASTLTTAAGPVELGGDRQHAGVQFRAAQEVAEAKATTRYLRPEKWKDLDPAAEYNDAAHRDLPWNALRYALGERSYTVAYLSHPQNPDGADFSERLYGRFGEFIPWRLTRERPLTLRYRFWVDAAGAASRETIEARYRDFASPPQVAIAAE